MVTIAPCLVTPAQAAETLLDDHFDADPCTADNCDALLGCTHVPIDGCGQIGGTSGTPTTPTVPALPLGGRAVLGTFPLMAGRAAARRGRRSACSPQPLRRP